MAMNNSCLWYELLKIEKLVKNFNVLVRPQGAKVIENRYFLNDLFSIIIYFNELLVVLPLINYWKELLKMRRMISNLSESVYIRWIYHHFNPAPISLVVECTPISMSSISKTCVKNVDDRYLFFRHQVQQLAQVKVRQIMHRYMRQLHFTMQF